MTDANNNVAGNTLPIEQIASWIAAIASISLLVSAIYEYSFLGGLGLKPFQIPLAISDISIQAFSWSRHVILFILGVNISTIFYKEKTILNIKSAITGDKKSFLHKYIINPIAITSYVIFISCLLYLLFGDKYHFMYILSITISVFYFACDYFIIKTNTHFFSVKIRRLLCLSILFIGIIYANGYENAQIETKSSRSDILTLSNGKMISGNILRSYSSGYIFYNGVAYFLPKEQVTQIQFESRKAYNPGLLCLINQQLCDTEYLTPQSKKTNSPGRPSLPSKKPSDQSKPSSYVSKKASQ